MCFSSHDRNRQVGGWSEQRSSLGAQQADFRVSDAERNQVIDHLKRHTSDGRLTLEEFEDRLDETMAAKTAGDLRAVLRDLPPIQTGAVVTPRRGGVRVPFIAVGVLLVLSVASGHPLIWLLLPIGFFWFRGFHRGPRRRFEERGRRSYPLSAERRAGSFWV
jgi:hypothetical protein